MKEQRWEEARRLRTDTEALKPEHRNVGKLRQVTATSPESVDRVTQLGRLGKGRVNYQAIQTDFDRIAELARGGWNHNSHYHEFLLKQLPAHCAEALEIGCGTGAFLRLLAKRSDRVLALDLSPRMIQIARERSRQYPNIEFQIADATTWAYPTERFDCVASLATLHHLPAEDTLSKMRNALGTSGTLIVLDLFQGQGLSDVLTSLLAVPVQAGLKLLKTGRLRDPRQVREAWAEHGRHDSYPTLSQVRQICAAVLP
ncbi:MAG TPA: class I SAM-dependent methyltransferase, partial [Anaerolineae bacterium]|nr:class I SAM-dependent methyltransferase [Anaerolineae bacterium]